MTLAPEHELVKSITTRNSKTAVEQYILATSKRSERERMADVKPFQGCLQGPMRSTLSPKNPSPFGLGIMYWQDMEQVLLWQSPVAIKEIMILPNILIFRFLIFLKDVDISEEAFTDKVKNSLGTAIFGWIRF